MYILKQKLNIKSQKEFCEGENGIGISRYYFSRIMNQKLPCSKLLAYAITKRYNKDLEIKDLFEVV